MGEGRDIGSFHEQTAKHNVSEFVLMLLWDGTLSVQSAGGLVHAYTQ